MSLRAYNASWLFGFCLLACHARSTGGSGGANYPNVDGAQRANEDTALLTRKPSNLSSDGGAAPTADESNPRDYDAFSDGLGDEPDDDLEDSDSTGAGAPALADVARRKHPLDTLSQEELEQRLKTAPDSLGSVSLGRPNAGALFNGVSLPDNEAWVLVDRAHAYGTQETVDALQLSLRAVYEAFPGTHAVSIGHLSAKHGGHLRPHRSHQSGRDVDIGFYYSGEPSRWYARATPANLDLERTVYLLRMLVENTDIDMVLIDRSLHEPLRRFALEHGLDAAIVAALFHTHDGRPPVVRHAPGHATHLHLRFKNPVAERSGQRLASLLTKHQLVVVPPKTVPHVARAGDTLAKLAARYRTSMREIRLQNAMAGTALVAGRTYRIPVVPSTGQPTQRARSTASATTRSSSKK